MSDERADHYLKLQERLKGNRGNFEIQWQEIAERILTRQSSFITQWQPGSKREFHVFDSCARLALPKFAAAMESIATPRTQTWHKLKPAHPDLQKSQAVLRYCDQLNRIVFAARYSPQANFSTQSQELYTSLGAFGTGGMFVDDAINDVYSHSLGLRYKSIFLGELFIMENSAGLIDHVHRRYKLTNRQAVQEFGDKCPKIIQEKANDYPDDKSEFLHVVCPNRDRAPFLRNYRGMPFASYHISYETRTCIREGGYRTMPFPVARYVSGTDETYGRSPAIESLPDIKMANSQAETLLRAGQLVVDPPTLLNDDGILAVFDRRPGSDNYGMLSADGKPLAVPFQSGANLPLGMEMIEATHKTINEAFLITLFQILVETDREMTAYEVMQRAQEKGALLAPVGGRLQDEFLGPTILRELDICARAGAFPPMPDELREAGGVLDLEYDSPLSRAQKAEQAIGLSNTFGILQPMAQINPDIMDRFDFDTISWELATEVNGLPATWLNDDKTLATIRAGRQQQNQLNQVVQAAPAMSAAAANIAKIQQAQGAGGGTLPGMNVPGAAPGPGTPQ